MEYNKQEDYSVSKNLEFKQKSENTDTVSNLAFYEGVNSMSPISFDDKWPEKRDTILLLNGQHEADVKLFEKDNVVQGFGETYYRVYDISAGLPMKGFTKYTHWMKYPSIKDSLK